MEHNAFTRRANAVMSEIRTEAGLFLVSTGQAVVPSNIEKFEAIWDTGATNTAASSAVIAKLGSQPITFTHIATGGGIVTAPVHLLNIVLPNNVIIPNITVTELKDLNSCDVLIGMNVITRGDFALTHVDGKTCFSFRMPSHKPIDFVPESNRHNLKLQRTRNRTAQAKAKSSKKRK